MQPIFISLKPIVFVLVLAVPNSCKKENLGLPVVSNLPVSAITGTTASRGGSISSDGDNKITMRGICWSTSKNPTIGLTTKTSDATVGGSFISNLTGLSPRTNYYLRAYATNRVGTAYGNQVSFSTSNSLFAPGSGVSDIEGNNYKSIILGTQEWMQENLKVGKYRNGDAIPTNLGDSAWEGTSSGAYEMYKDVSENTTYGKLYNFYAVSDPRGLCPTGWHVPTDSEWYTLENFVDPSFNDPKVEGYDRGTDAGGKLKAVSSIWRSPNIGATNSSGFTALPGGCRPYYGSIFNIGYGACWWSSTLISSEKAMARQLYHNFVNSHRFGLEQTFGLSVRCLKD